LRASVFTSRPISLYVYAYNKAAIGLYHKVGFKESGRLREGVQLFGKRYDVVIMDILSREFEGNTLKKGLEKRYEF